MGMLTLAVAPVIGTAPSNWSAPLKWEYVRMIALLPTGVITYARGAKSWDIELPRGTNAQIRSDTCKLSFIFPNVGNLQE